MLGLFFFLFTAIEAQNCPVGNYSAPLNSCLLALADKTFYDAEMTCINMGGHLVTIKNAAQNTEVLNFARSSFCCATWIGLDRSGFWQDGTAEGFTNYAPSRVCRRIVPCSDQPTSDFRCVQLDQSQNGKWISLNCTQLTDFICSIPPRNPNMCLTGWTFYPKTNYCYKNMKDYPNLDWNQANARCKEFGAQLASIHNRDENHFIQTLAASSLSRRDLEDQTWIGLQVIDFKEGNYTVKWSDGTATNYLNYVPGEPNGKGKEKCILMITDFNYIAEQSLAKWVDHFCATKLNSFMCKMKPTS